jgi:hypothetical protein
VKRSHAGVAMIEGSDAAKALTAEHRRNAHPVEPDPVRKVCRADGCGRKVMYVRKTYGPHAKAGHWQHVGDGLAQYRSWGVSR